MKCRFEGLSRKGNQMWGNWVFSGVDIESHLIGFCRRALDKSYRNYWIRAVYFDDKYIYHTDKFFKEVGVELYPRVSEIGLVEDVDEKRKAFRNVAKMDIQSAIESGVEPIRLKVYGIRYKDDDGIYQEEIKGVEKVMSL